MKYLEKFKKSSFLQNTSILMAGTVIASIIPALIQPVLTRIYSPEDFGLYGLYFSLIGIFSVIAALRYEVAVPLPKEKIDTDRLAILSLIIAAIVSTILFVIAILFRHDIARFMNNPKMSTWIVMVPIGVFFAGMYQTFNYWLVRHKAFKESAINRISQKATDSPIMVALGYLQIGSGQIIGDFFGRIAMAIVAMFQAMKNGFTFKSYNKPALKQLATQYKDFPLYNSLPSLADSFGIYLPIILISNIFSDTEAGFYTNTRNLLSIPLIFISRNVSQVLYERFVDRKNKGLTIYTEVKKLFIYMSLAVVPAFIILVVISPQLFAFIFGKEWGESGVYTQILALAYALRFLNGSLTVVFSVLERIKLASIWQVYFFIAISSLWLLKNQGLTIYEFLFALMAVEAVSYCIYLYLTFKICREYDKSL